MILRNAAPVLIALSAALLASCSSDDTVTPGNTPSPQPQTIDVDMTIKDFSFNPTLIQATLGDEFRIALHNDGESEHTFTVNEFGVDQRLASGQDEDVRFTPNQPGEFTFYCRNHPDKMHGAVRIARPGEATSTAAADNQGGGSVPGY